MARTVDQQIAEAEAKLARLKARAKATETRRKIIVGAIVTTEALRSRAGWPPPCARTPPARSTRRN